MTVAAGTGGGLLCVTCQMGFLHLVEGQCRVQVHWDTGCHPPVIALCLSVMLHVAPASVQAFPWRQKQLSKLNLFYGAQKHTMC